MSSIPTTVDAANLDTSRSGPFGYSRSLFTIFLVEMWERFSFFGLASILILYLTADTSDGGANYTIARAASLFALYVALIFVGPVFGGWVADRLIGAKRAVLFGGATIVAGHLIMFQGSLGAVLVGMGTVVVGTGLLKPNTASMVGDLYPPGNEQRDAAFSVFYMGIHIGALCSPLITGYLAVKVSWEAGFVAAGIGMSLGLVNFLLDWRRFGDLGSEVPRPLSPDERHRLLTRTVPAIIAVIAVAVIAVIGLSVSMATIQKIVTVAIVVLSPIYFTYMIRSSAKTQVESRHLSALFILFAVTGAWYAVGSQAGSLLNYFAEVDTNRELFGIDFPAAWFQSIAPASILIFAPVTATIWIKMGKRQPNTPLKFIIGLVVIAISMGLMIHAAHHVPHEGEPLVRVSPFWLISVFMLQGLGELMIGPIGLAAASQLSPANARSRIMGTWYLSWAIGAGLAGVLANLYGTFSVSQYYGFLGVLTLVTAGALALALPMVNRLMRGEPAR